MVVSAKPVTVEELWELRHEPYRLALIDGELYRMPGAGGTHGAVTVRFCSRLDPFVTGHRLGMVFAETGFKLFSDRLTTLFPDVAFVSASRLPKSEAQERFLHLAPDLAVEVSSPTDYPKLIHEKLVAYFAAGTSVVWVVYPRKRSIAVYRTSENHIMLGPDDFLEGGDVLPGFSIRVADLFP